MKYLRLVAFFLLLPLYCFSAFAGDPQAPTNGPSANAPHLSKQTRIELGRLLNAELVYVRSPFPRGRDGLKLHNGRVTPSGAQPAPLVATVGPGGKKGEAVRT